MSKATTKSKKLRLKKGAWFYPVRGSYLPASWQAWSLYLIAAVFILLPFAAAINDEESAVSSVTSFLTRILLVGIALTAVAQKKS